MYNLSENPQIVEPDYEGDRTLLLIPSISFGDFVLKQYQGPQFFEERYLYFLTFLKQPRTNIILVLSDGMEYAVYDYFAEHIGRCLDMNALEWTKRIARITVPGMPAKSLTHSIVQHPEYVKKIKEHITNSNNTFIEFFRVAEEEIELSRLLDVPIYGLSASAINLNTKSAARKLFAEVGMNIPRGFEDLFSLEEIFQKLRILFSQSQVKKTVIKVNDAGSGLGFIFTNRDEMPDTFIAFDEHVQKKLGDTYDLVMEGISKTGAVAEEYLQAKEVVSPSAQFEIKPDGRVINLATHDQILHGVEYIGVNFPAHEEYRIQIMDAGYKIAQAAYKKGAMGIFAIDFLLTRNSVDDPWKLWCIEINARKGGTNHTYMWAKYLTNATYNEGRGLLECDKGDVYYRGSEVFMKYDWLRQVEPSYLLEHIKNAGLDFSHETKSGVLIHLLSPLKHFGKFGCTIIGHSREEVDNLCKKLETVVLSLQENYALH